ncbi:chaperone Hsp40 [Candidatus Nasuia deltocephalinicola]|uniref:Chaperone protein DnaJ n=1 Tax=Candidatus Nasuia deltocephalincola TaxID=1160784 RepID=A0A975A372_9PROT|nr:hypothetical protein CU086_00605 [Candidatus Nasuia deltocephalinicola]WKD87078.1 J domain-containing protein [Candidatus Nasuia deltocephalinicola]BEH03861.1 chaperone Hsp40 [Candidatus Nasuia deltocephalinicola]
MKDYYKVLGVNRNSSLEDIKMAYKKLAMKYHPDRNSNDLKSEEKFKEIKEAYEFLTNKNNFKNSNNFHSENINFSDFSTSESSLDDIFNVIFQKNFKKDNKFYFSLEINLETAIYGATIDLKIPYKGTCQKCFGKGNKPGSDMKICSKCHGSGFYTIMQGIFSFKQKCYKCGGKGYVSVEICLNCSGVGKVDKKYNCNIFINKNSDNNTQISLKHLKSDEFLLDNCYILIKIKPHNLFLRKNLKNNDLFLNYYLDFSKAILGGYIKVFTIYGYILYRISKYTQNNKYLKIPGFGLNFKNRFGDLYVYFFIEIPVNINYNQWFLINKLRISTNFSENYLFSNINSYNSFLDNIFKLF